jgi:hypothetical protein
VKVTFQDDPIFSGTTNYRICLLEYTCLNCCNLLDVPDGNAGLGTSGTIGSMNTTHNNDLILGAIIGIGPTSLTDIAGNLVRIDSGHCGNPPINNDIAAFYEKIATVTGNYTEAVTFSAPALPWVSAGAALRGGGP